jgi:hypothetical protein
MNRIAWFGLAITFCTVPALDACGDGSSDQPQEASPDAGAADAGSGGATSDGGAGTGGGGTGQSAGAAGSAGGAAQAGSGGSGVAGSGVAGSGGQGAAGSGNAAGAAGTDAGALGCPPDNPEPIPDQKINWMGHDWYVTDYQGTMFYTDQVCMDAAGRLHIRGVDRNAEAHALNVILSNSVGHGTFSLTLDSDWAPVQNAHRRAVFAPFLYDSTLSGPNQNYGEIDLEASNWGDDQLDGNVDFTIHSVDKAACCNNEAHVQYTPVHGVGNTWTIEWMADHVTWQISGPSMWNGSMVNSKGATVFNPLTLSKQDLQAMGGDVPPQTGHMAYLLYVDARPIFPSGFTGEVILSHFQYTPAP